MLQLNVQGVQAQPIFSGLNLYYKELVIGTKKDGTLGIIKQTINNNGITGAAKDTFISQIVEGFDVKLSVEIEPNQWKVLENTRLTLDKNVQVTKDFITNITSDIMKQCRAKINELGVPVLNNALEFTAYDEGYNEKLKAELEAQTKQGTTKVVNLLDDANLPF